MPTTPLVSKPGQFRARCNLRRQVPWDKMTAELWEIALARGYERVFREMESGRRDPEKGKKGRWEVSFAACDGFETTDRKVYAAHLEEFHSGGRLKLTQPRMHRNGSGMWKGPRLTEDGTPWSDEKQPTVTCPCGLVMEEGASHEAELFIREHLEHCAEQAGAA